MWPNFIIDAQQQRCAANLSLTVLMVWDSSASWPASWYNQVSMRLPLRVMEVYGGLWWQAGLGWCPGNWSVIDGCVKWLTNGSFVP